MYGTVHVVGDVMTRTVVALDNGAAFKDIVRAMRKWKIGSLPVVDGEYRVLGVVSEADLLPKEELRDGGGDPDAVPLPVRLRLAAMAKAGGRTAGELYLAIAGGSVAGQNGAALTTDFASPVV